MQWTTRVNEAYRTLTSPVQRAKYLLEMHGVDVQFETNTQMPTDFLLQQLALREALEAAQQQPAALDSLLAQVRHAKSLLELDMARLIDSRKDYAAAAGEVRKLMFLERLGEEIDQAYEGAP
jgi:molecular chaperone HscB